MAHSRYAILLITVLAAVITPTPDVFNLTLFAVPMVLLYFVGVFASYVLVLKRENRRFPWKPFFLVMGVILALIGIALYIAVIKYHYRLVLSWPFLVR
jgi:sec-independent protein translocase protein TatC